MARVYERTGEIDVHERARPTVTRHATHETRDAEVTRVEQRVETNPQKWINPSSLDAPEPRAGYVQRWVSDGTDPAASQDVKRTWGKKMREGWSPRDPNTIPPGLRQTYASSKLTTGQGVIGVAGLVLCEMPRQVALQRYQAVNESVDRLSSSVPSSMDELRERERSKNRVSDLDITDKVNSVRGRKAPTMV